MDVDNQFSDISVTALFYIHALQVCHCCLALIVHVLGDGEDRKAMLPRYIIIAAVVVKFPHSALTTLFSNSEITYH